MSVKLDSFEEQLDKIRTHLPEYMGEQGYDVREGRKIVCISPDHNDSNPSMSLYEPEDGHPMLHCFSCLPGHELIYTRFGFKSIDSVQVGDQVLGLNRTYDKVTNVQVTTGKKCKLYKIKTYACKSGVELTEDHKVFTAPRTFFSRQNGYFFCNKERSLLRSRVADELGTIEKMLIEEKRVDQIDIDNDIMLYPIDRSDGQHKVVGFSHLSSMLLPDDLDLYSKSVSFDIRTAWAFGVYLRCGSLFPDGIKFSLSKSDKVAMSTLVKVMTAVYGVKPSIHTYSHALDVVDIIFTSMSLQFVFHALCGHDNSVEKVPWPLLTADKEVKRSFLNGLFLGTAGGFHLSYSSRSKGAACGMFSLANSIGIMSWLSQSSPVAEGGEEMPKVYKVTFQPGARDYIDLKSEKIASFKGKDSHSSFYAYINGTQYLCSSIASIETKNNVYHKVYDLEVEGSKSFTTSSFVVHNCSMSFDIFTAAHALEHKPKLGPAFVSENVMYLAKKYGIEITVQKLTEEEVYEMNTYEAYRLASEYISSAQLNDAAIKELEYRGWDLDKVRGYRVGQCDNYDRLRRTLKASGFSAKFLDDVDLSNKIIFSPHNLLFTICDDYGRPVGFAARNLKYDGQRDDNNRLIHGPKFNNTKTTGVKCNIYRKSERLYLLDIAKAKGPPLVIVEGYGDALTAHLGGLENVAALGALHLSEHHLNACRRNGIYDVIICLDGDSAGQDKARTLLDDILGNVHDIKIRFIFLEEEVVEGVSIKMDPDIFIRTHGAEAFYALPKIDPFEWRLLEFLQDDQATPESICYSMIPIIASEPSAIRKEGMIRDLSEHTGFSDRVIREELERIIEGEEEKIVRRKSGVIATIKMMLEKRSESPELVLQRGIDDLYKIERERNAGSLTSETMLTTMLDIKQYEEQEDLHSSIDFGPNFRTFALALAGDLRGKMIVLGGQGNVGKTSKFCNLAWNLGSYNDDIVPIILTIDDSSRELVPRLVAYDMAMRAHQASSDLFEAININRVATPFLFKEEPEYEMIMREREISFGNLFSLVKEERMVVLDSENGTSIDFINSTMKHYTERYPDKRVMMFIDNFHLLSAPRGLSGREKYQTLSKDLKQVCTTHGGTIFTTAEYRKLQPGNKPSNTDLAETVALEYDSNAILHLYSELHDKRDSSALFHLNAEGVKSPIVEMNFGKNKVNSYKGKVYYKFYPEKALYMEVTPRYVANLEGSNQVAMEQGVGLGLDNNYPS